MAKRHSTCSLWVENVPQVFTVRILWLYYIPRVFYGLMFLQSSPIARRLFPGLLWFDIISKTLNMSVILTSRNSILLTDLLGINVLCQVLYGHKNGDSLLFIADLWKVPATIKTSQLVLIFFSRRPKNFLQLSYSNTNFSLHTLMSPVVEF